MQSSSDAVQLKWMTRPIRRPPVDSVGSAFLIFITSHFDPFLEMRFLYETPIPYRIWIAIWILRTLRRIVLVIIGTKTE